MTNDQPTDALLASFDKPVGLLEAYCFPTARTLTMSRSRRSMIGGNFDLFGEDGELVLNVDTKLRHGKTFSDPTGKEVLHSGTSTWTRATTITLPGPDGKEVGWVKSNVTGSYKIGARFIDFASGQERILGMKGDWKSNANLVIDDEVVAIVNKNKITKSERVIRIAANIDIALVFAAAVLFDQMVNDTTGTIVAIT